jgi:UDP-glucose 4-epimerase
VYKEKPKSIFVTGGTGFLGKKVIELLQRHYAVTVLTRKKAATCQSDSWQAEPCQTDPGLQIKYIVGDLKSWHAGLDTECLRPGQYDLMLHMAGLYDLRASQVDSYIHNVVATNHALALAQKLKIEKFIFTSSVAASINTDLRQVKPTDLDFTRPFPDYYSEAKALCEQMIHHWEDGPSLKINLRLGILTGDTEHGEIERVDGPYHAYRAFEKVRTFIENWPGVLPLPGDSERKLPFVPVDIAAKAIVKFCDWAIGNQTKGTQNHHLTPTLGVGVRDFYTSILKNLSLHKIQTKKDIFLLEGWPLGVINPFAEHLLNFPKEELTYLLKIPSFETSSTRLILGENWCPEYAAYERKLWRGYQKFSQKLSENLSEKLSETKVRGEP